MPKKNFYGLLEKEIGRIDESKTSKRHEKVISGFTPEHRAIIGGKPYLIFNSNDYLGLRHHPAVKKAEMDASERYGAGPGAVRFISGTMQVHTDLETTAAKFHGREDAMAFSSAFAANLAVLHCIIKGQSRTSLVGRDALVISDELNHRSIIDGIRVAGLEKQSKAIYKHMDYDDLERVLEENKGKFKRVLLVSDGIFSMLGECGDIGKIQAAADKYNGEYEEGVITVIDDSHGVGCFGATGRGCEEATNGKSDIILATFGKGFGVDGGYVAGDKVMMDYLRESAATYIYSNPVAPGTAGAACKSMEIVDSPEGEALLEKLNGNIAYFKTKMKETGFVFAVDSPHAIQPLLIGDAAKARLLTDSLFEEGVLVTNISFPVVQRGRDEIRVQISAAHSKKDIDEFVEKASRCAKKSGIL